jgi:hypothetical protein
MANRAPPVLIPTAAGAPSQHVQKKKKTPKPPSNLPVYSWRTLSPTPRLIYIRHDNTADAAILELQRHQPLGFDLEWKPVFVKDASQNPVALVQLANESTVLLLQVTAMRRM